uniref:RNA methyltransferase n=1 Tax=Prasinoderma coloniale TaxID=156133 RepID=A0A7R9TH50_9VIRI|eukprot:PRCOL_00002662-RA
MGRKEKEHRAWCIANGIEPVEEKKSNKRKERDEAHEQRAAEVECEARRREAAQSWGGAGGDAAEGRGDEGHGDGPQQQAEAWGGGGGGGGSNEQVEDPARAAAAAAADYGVAPSRAPPRPTEAGHDLPTLTIALPGSIVENTQSFELATALAGQIARAAAVFRVDEIVVFEEETMSGSSKWRSTIGGGASAGGGGDGPTVFLARVLQYLEMPQYLRKALIPMHRDLRLAGLLPPTDMPHHPRRHEWSVYREGVTVGDGASSRGEGTPVDVGLDAPVSIAQELPKGMRVTVRMGPEPRVSGGDRGGRGYGGGYNYSGTHGKWDVKGIKAAVAPTEPRAVEGAYNGYTVRCASGLSGVFSGCPWEGGYDLCLGTSEHGVPLSSDAVKPDHKHLMVVLGGLYGLEASAKSDPQLQGVDVATLFDAYINTCPEQGSRTIRTEEALLITLSAMQPFMPAYA